MVFVRLYVDKASYLANRLQLMDGVRHALLDAMGIPPRDVRQVVIECDLREHQSAEIEPLDQKVSIVVEITLRRGRSDSMKRQLFFLITRNFESSVGCPPGEVLIFLQENDYSCWSPAQENWTIKVERTTRPALLAPSIPEHLLRN